MILSCPACQSQFKVDPALIGPDGRKVRCAKCSHVWKVGPDGAPIVTGQFGMKSARPATPATPVPPGPQRAAATGGPEPEPQVESTAKSAPRPDEAAASTSTESKEEEGAETQAAEVPVTPEAVAGAAVRAVRRAKAQKGGRKFRIFLLLVCLAVIALFMAGVITGRIGLGGLSPRSQIPATGDVAPPPPVAPQQER